MNIKEAFVIGNQTLQAKPSWETPPVGRPFHGLAKASQPTTSGPSNRARPCDLGMDSKAIGADGFAACFLRPPCWGTWSGARDLRREAIEVIEGSRGRPRGPVDLSFSVGPVERGVVVAGMWSFFWTVDGRHH